MKSLRRFAVTVRSFMLTALAAGFTGCASPSVSQQGGTVEQQAARCLTAAAAAAPRMGADAAARQSYNTSSAELTALLRSADGGRLWSHPSTLTADGKSWCLRFDPGTAKGLWPPDYFTSLRPASAVPLKDFRTMNHVNGSGGALVGIRTPATPEPFVFPGGITAAVTATLDFHGDTATLTLRDPIRQPTARIAGAERTLEADFAAPLAPYVRKHASFHALKTALTGADDSGPSGPSGLYLLQPYDPDRIPLIFVHGLISSPQLWRDVINEIETDPALRRRYQPWVFGYPTGNPIAWSADKFRDDLAKVQKRYGLPHGMVLVGHSMGGLLSRMQITTTNMASYEQGAGREKARAFFAGIPADSPIRKALLFAANPKISRVIFICTPHRGSPIAAGRIGNIGTRLMSISSSLARTLTGTVSASLALVTGSADRMPTSVSGLSSDSPLLKALDTLPMRTPHHSIIGDRGKGDTPSSSDGAVEYWSSHQKTAQSELIVPSGHSACDKPETIAEIKRILHLHLKSSR